MLIIHNDISSSTMCRRSTDAVSARVRRQLFLERHSSRAFLNCLFRFSSGVSYAVTSCQYLNPVNFRTRSASTTKNSSLNQMQVRRSVPRVTCQTLTVGASSCSISARTQPIRSILRGSGIRFASFGPPEMQCQNPASFPCSSGSLRHRTQ